MNENHAVSCDVLVVGGGGAGLAAAIEAADRGARVVLIEKNPALGGTTAWSIGSFTATQTPHQIARGIEDSPDEHFADMPKFSGPHANRDNPALRRLFVDNASETLRWLMGFGVEFFGPMPEPPHEKPRMHNVLPNSKAYIHRLGSRARRVGVDIRLGWRATSFVLEADRVAGAVCQARNGQTIQIDAGSVVLASGDYAGSAELKARFISDAVAQVDAMNPTATGDGHLMAMELGAEVLNGDILSGPNLRFLPPERPSLDRLVPPWRWVGKAMGIALKYAPERALRPFVLRFTTTSMAPELDLFAKGALLVNRDGARVAGKPGALGLAIAGEPDKIGYVIMDAALARLFTAWPNFIATAPGVAYAYLDDFRRTRPDIFHRADSLEALAERLSMDPDKLAGAVSAHNAESDVRPRFAALRRPGPGQKLHRPDRRRACGERGAAGPWRRWRPPSPVSTRPGRRVRAG